MGRHAGWITAATGLAQAKAGQAPHVLLFPEIAFDPDAFLAKVDAAVKQFGYCAVGVSEGLHDSEGKFLAESGLKDAFGHSQLGGVAPRIAELVRGKLNLKHHWAVADYLQRAARHIASKTDLEQSYAVGKAAVEFAVKGMAAKHARLTSGGLNPFVDPANCWTEAEIQEAMFRAQLDLQRKQTK